MEAEEGLSGEIAVNVAELIKHLQAQPQDLLVGYRQYSEMCLLKPEDIEIMDACAPRPDGWIQRKRPDEATQPYLIFPGN